MKRRRRLLIALGAGALAAPFASFGQPAKLRRIGFLGTNAPSAWENRVEAFRAGLRDLGYVEGKNVAIEFRWAEGKVERLRAFAAELAQLKVDVIVTYGTPGARAAKEATSTIPIVMVVAGDAVSTGLVADLARPGENITGSSFFSPELGAKRLELIKEAVPRITNVAALMNADNIATRAEGSAMEAAARSLKLGFESFWARGPADFDGVFSAMAAKRVDALIIPDDAVFLAQSKALADLALKHRMPGIASAEFVNAGGLIGYGVNFLELYRYAAVFVDKIFKGAKPGEVPINRATTFESIVNLKTARALGVAMPQSILLRADRVIE